jgi:hypothetical protein
LCQCHDVSLAVLVEGIPCRPLPSEFDSLTMRGSGMVVEPLSDFLELILISGPIHRFIIRRNTFLACLLSNVVFAGRSLYSSPIHVSKTLFFACESAFSNNFLFPIKMLASWGVIRNPMAGGRVAGPEGTSDSPDDALGMSSDCISIVDKGGGQMQ